MRGIVEYDESEGYFGSIPSLEGAPGLCVEATEWKHTTLNPPTLVRLSVCLSVYHSAYL